MILNKLLKTALPIILTTLFISCTTREIVVPEDEEWSFIVYGDTRGGYDIHKKLILLMSKIEPKPKATFCVGDMITTPGSFVQWELFWASAQPLQLSEIPLYLVKGNHDANDSATTEIYNEQANPPGGLGYYAITINSILFIILDTEITGEAGSIKNNQLTWLKNQLDYASSEDHITNIMLFMHRPLYPQGGHIGQNLYHADQLHELFLKHQKIKVVFAGHDHLFNKFYKDGLLYIESGGGGAELHSDFEGAYYHFIKVSLNIDNTFNFKTIGVFNETIEEWNL